MAERFSSTTKEDVGETRPRSGPEPTPAFLFRLIECESPVSLPARSCLRGVDEVAFGRRPERSAEVVGRKLALGLPDHFLSTSHATLRRTDEGWLLRDEGSKNGTLVGGARIEERLLADGDLLEVGRTLLLFRAALAAPAGAPAHLEASSLGVREPGLLTLDPALETALLRLRAVAPSRLPVVFTGETGTGKELAAAALHSLSGRSGPLVAINCAAIAPSLLESQLFGHKKGAFSGALEDTPGLVRASDRGTLFLDEVGELTPLAQAALLRVLAQGQVLPVGGTQAVPVDLRLACATNRDLTAMVAAGTFRADLLSRLQGLVVALPPLRLRLADLGLLVSALLRRHARDPAAVRLLPEAARALARHRWPLNVRELDQALAAALLLSGGQPIACRGPKTRTRSRPRTRSAPASCCRGEEYAEAEALLSKVLAAQRRLETPRDPSSISTLHHLARACALQAKFAQAEALFAEALERERRVLGPDGLYTMDSMDALALALSWEGKLAEAEALFTQTLAARRRVLGAEHPATLDTMADLGQVLVAQGKSAAAEPLAREAATGDEKIRPDSWQHFFAESVLGASLLGQKRAAAARPLLLAGQRGLQARKQLVPAPDRFRLERAREWLAQPGSSLQ